MPFLSEILLSFSNPAVASEGSPSKPSGANSWPFAPIAVPWGHAGTSVHSVFDIKTESHIVTGLQPTVVDRPPQTG